MICATNRNLRVFYRMPAGPEKEAWACDIAHDLVYGKGLLDLAKRFRQGEQVFLPTSVSVDKRFAFDGFLSLDEMYR